MKLLLAKVHPHKDGGVIEKPVGSKIVGIRIEEVRFDLKDLNDLIRLPPEINEKYLCHLKNQFPIAKEEN